MNNKRFIILFALATLIKLEVAFSQDYIKYHLLINKAEEEVFVNKEITKGLKTYLEVFKEYDFVYLQDCVTALQITLYANDEKRFFVIVKKAAENGLLLRHLQHIKYIQTHPLFNKNKDSVAHIIKLNRNYYLKRIDTAALKTMYSLYAWDQLEKNPMEHERYADYYIRYKSQINEAMNKMKKLISEKGFPSDKLIGVDQNNIMAELRTGSPDLKDYYYRYKDDYNVRLTQFDFDEKLLSSTLYYPLIHHYEHTYSSYKLFDNGFYLHQIALGFLHPKDFAAINDISYYVFENKKPDTARGEMFFAVGMIDSYFDTHPLAIPDSVINKCRAKYFIPPIENDRAKWHFMNDHGMYLGWGWLGCRM